VRAIIITSPGFREIFKAQYRHLSRLLAGASKKREKEKKRKRKKDKKIKRKKDEKMSAPSEAGTYKLDNPTWIKLNQQSRTKPRT